MAYGICPEEAHSYPKSRRQQPQKYSLPVPGGQKWPNTKFFDIDAEVWFQESLPGQGCPQHEHGTLSRYSWVYYLDVGENNSPLTFIEMKETKNEVFPVDEIHLPVYNDMVVMFPSNIHHKVYPVNATRYILAGNINDIAQKEN